jgi:hypothetical protein
MMTTMIAKGGQTEMAGPRGPAIMADIKMMTILISRSRAEEVFTTTERQRRHFTDSSF